MKQQRFFKSEEKSHGGDLLKKRKGRGARPLDTRNTMHLVLRSTQATGPRSFKRHRTFIDRTLARFAEKFGVRIHGFANVGNHLHIHIKLGNRHTWRGFIRAVTAAIAMKIGSKNRWNPKSKPFWDRRPFTRVVIGRRGYRTLVEYIKLNVWEGQGVCRDQVRSWFSTA